MTVQADAIANYSHLFRRSEGLYLSFSNQESMEEDFLEQIKGRDIDLVVCSDSEAILGIGDQGVGVNLSVILTDAAHEQVDLSRELGYLQPSSFLQRWSDYVPY
jgi:malate dehydrogenase (oxaloacetate-decarboxylating)